MAVARSCGCRTSGTSSRPSSRSPTRRAYAGRARASARSGWLGFGCAGSRTATKAEPGFRLAGAAGAHTEPAAVRAAAAAARPAGLAHRAGKLRRGRPPQARLPLDVNRTCAGPTVRGVAATGGYVAPVPRERRQHAPASGPSATKVCRCLSPFRAARTRMLPRCIC